MNREEFLNLKPTEISKNIYKEYYTDYSFISSDQLIEKNIKTQILNGIKLRIEEIKKTTENTLILNAVYAHELIIADAYKIDIYKFQFKNLMNILNKELDNIVELILLESPII